MTTVRENMNNIERLTLSGYPAVLFLVIFMFSNSLGWFWPGGSQPLLISQIFKGINLLALIIYCGSTVLVLAKTPLSSNVIFYVAILICILAICFLSSYHNHKTHYSYFLYPLLWTTLLIRAAALPAYTNGMLPLFAIIVVFIITQALVLLVQTSSVDHAILYKEHDGLFYRRLPSFPANFEAHYMGYLGMLLALYAYFKKNAAWAFFGVVGALAVVFCDSRSSMLALTLSLLLFSTIGFKFTLLGFVFRILSTLGILFVLMQVVPKFFDYPVGPSSIDNTKPSETATSIEGIELPTQSSAAPNQLEPAENSIDLNDHLPVGSRVEAPKNAENYAEIIEQLEPGLAGRTYSSYFQDTGGRFSVWRAAIERILEKPMLGNGHFASVSTQIISGENSPHTFINSLYHNSFLQIGVDYGIPALLLWLITLAIFFLRASPICKTIIFAHCCHFSFQNEFLVGEVSFFIVLLSILIPTLNSESLQEKS